MEELKKVITTKLDNLKVNWVDSGTNWLLSQCPNPNHKDTHPSMFINTTQGFGKCQVCDFVVSPKFFGADSDEETKELFLNSTFHRVLQQLEEKFATLEQKVFQLPPFGAEITREYRGLPVELLHKAKVYNCKLGRFKDRLIFPFYNLDNELVGYTGRINGNAPNFSSAKYIHATGIQTNQFVLYGQLIKELNLTTSKGLVVVEGNLDALALISKGIPATPLLGFKKPTDNFIIEVIKLGFDNIIIAFDNDEVGRKKMFFVDRNIIDAKDQSIFKYWAKEFSCQLGFYCKYPLVKALYKSNHKDFHEFICEA